MFILTALSLAVFVPSLYSSGITAAPAGMVYCPLSRKFQPVKLSEENKKPASFEEICATPEKKEFLFREIVINQPLQSIFLNETKLDDLAFDYLVKGKAALERLPNLPDSPLGNLKGQTVSGAVAANYDYQFSRHQITASVFSYKLTARPPTTGKPASFILRPVFQSPLLSRRLAPRAPPVLS